MKAYCLIREQPVYRRESFLKGLAACGYSVHTHAPADARPGDVLVIWNRYGTYHDMATRFESRGGIVVVAENGYVANDRANRTRYAIALHAHNGQGAWRPLGPERWRSFGIEVAPYRTEGAHILVAPNRSFGIPGYMMPPVWAEDVVKRLERATKRPVRLRPHPGNGPAKVPLEHDLRDAWAVVIWTSSVGVEALIRGIPVVCEAPKWIAKGATTNSVRGIDAVPLLDRTKALEDLAWAQWHIAEIERGDPFQHLLHGT